MHGCTQVKRCLSIGLVCLAAVSFAGCERALFPENLPRTQFERYDRLRGRYVPTERYDRYGDTSPALRERLTPPES
ncbi:MAG: hypothetical protein CMJ49_01385 [Planctomycetaceae bacterium]|nr:hypothetical protein [Planctomycetaceae bacterium]